MSKIYWKLYNYNYSTATWHFLKYKFIKMDKKLFKKLEQYWEEKIIKWKNCKNCSKEFAIYEKDINFLKSLSPSIWNVKIDLPLPTLCPDCRAQRRMAFKNNWKLYKRKCDLTWKTIVSIFSPDKDYIVYDAKEWRTDKWDALDYWQDFDFSKPFFEQFDELLHKVPLMSKINNETRMYNSDYCNDAWEVKNSYLCFGAAYIENCYYCRDISNSKNCVDCLNVDQCENCYYCIDSTNLFNCFYTINCHNSSNLYYCIDCINCTDCFLSSNLRGKKYYFQNKPYSKDEYYKKVKEYIQKHSLTIQPLKALLTNTIHKNLHNINTENSIWNFLKNTYNNFYCFENAETENCRYCDKLMAGWIDSYNMDIYSFWSWAERCYECQTIWWNPIGVYNLLFCDTCIDWCENLIYCYMCYNCKNCFGCAWLKNKQYCIFNKQYSKEEYEKLVIKIIQHMKTTWEWWEFFPINISPFWYNETFAQEYFPLTKEEALKKGYKWQKEHPINVPQWINTLSGESLPSITNLSKEEEIKILNSAIICVESKKPFRIIKQELEFYKKYNLPLPNKHPDIRHQERMQLRPWRKITVRNCDNCWKEILSTYDNNAPFKVYCQKCYEKTID